MRYFKLTIAYDGTDFHGWQIQTGKPTIQGEIVEVLRRLTQEHVVLHGTGRTDAGVHAIASLGAGFSARAERAASARDSHRGRG
jgi:tRNA pseudouridine38-40 synthase